MKKYFFFHILVSCFLIGCGITQPIRTLDEGTMNAVVSLGGPVAPLAGIPIPLPYLNTGIVYGQKNNLTIFANAHVTALLFKNIGIDGGIVSALIKEKGIRPEVTLKAQGYFFLDFIRGNNRRFLPVVTVNASYLVGETSLFYFGADNAFQLSNSEYFVSPFLGFQFPISDVIDLQTEVKWMAANKNTAHGVFEGTASLKGNGNIGLFFGLNYKLAQ